MKRHLPEWQQRLTRLSVAPANLGTVTIEKTEALPTKKTMPVVKVGIDSVNFRGKIMQWVSRQQSTFRVSLDLSRAPVMLPKLLSNFLVTQVFFKKTRLVTLQVVVSTPQLTIGKVQHKKNSRTKSGAPWVSLIQVFRTLVRHGIPKHCIRSMTTFMITVFRTFINDSYSAS